MRILVTGATGLIGCHAIAALLDARHQVRAYVRSASKIEAALAPLGHSEADLEIAVGSVDEAAALSAALDGCDGLLHCAGIFSPDKRDADLLVATNVEGTRRVLEAAAASGLERVVYVSSILALFPPSGATMTANDEVASPTEMYAATKAAADRLARAAQETMPLSIVYPAAVHGPMDPTFSIGPQLVANALATGSVLVTEGGLPTTDVRDLATLIASLFSTPDPPARIMAPSFFMRHDDYHHLLENLTGRSLTAQRIPGWLLRVMGRLGDVAAGFGRSMQLTSEAAQVLTRSVPVDDAEACRLLGREKISEASSFRELIHWMVREGHVDSAHAGLAARADIESND